MSWQRLFSLVLPAPNKGLSVKVYVVARLFSNIQVMGEKKGQDQAAEICSESDKFSGTSGE